ncbi:helix-turn-helix domain-containing protein [uncultured Senegalimassilia sp.]|uniref:helix-turn-helix domain-containing protein n=1 Tax=uncultured Senegalimassilia sp. TaxID=1714350 RepID=UPI0026E10C31|nr:helix-turn-helix transcriptional regulator [uncultured Senegalimassilia sp.]
MSSTDEELINRLQTHLSTIRKAAGWSGERLANELGITKQTVSSLETGKTHMTKMHYLAIRAVFNNEIAVSGNEDLAKIIQLFVDQPVARELERLQKDLEEKKAEAEKAKREVIAKQSAIVGATALTAALIPASSALIPALSSLAHQLTKSIKK